ncbi:MAG: hypothetical protein AAGD35_12105 [Actinomycetota bacterium]
MNDDHLRAALEQRGARGTERGHDHLWRAALAEVDSSGGDEFARARRRSNRAADRATGPTSSGGRNRLLFVAAVIVAAGLGVGAVRLLAGGADSTVESDVADGAEPSPTPAEPTDGDGIGGSEQTEPGPLSTDQPADVTTTMPPSDGAATTPPPSDDEPGEVADDEPDAVADGPDVGIDGGWFGTIAGARQMPADDGSGWEATVESGTIGSATGGALRRTTGPHRGADGVLIIEVDYAASVDERGDSAWGEVVVTTADRVDPGPPRGLFAAQQFPGGPAFGCRLHNDREPFCNLYDAEGKTIWQMSTFQAVGRETAERPDGSVWRRCSPGQGPANCTERFRVQLTADSVTLSVNGVAYLRQVDVPDIPAALLGGDVYVYSASMISRHPQATATFHWGPLLIG